MAPPRACAPCPCPAQVLSLSIEKVRAANAAGSDELDSLLDAAFDASGLGLLCLTGGEEFQDEVRRIRRELLPLAPALSNLPEDSLADIAERPGSRNVNGYSRGVDGHRSGFYFHPASDDPGASLPAGVEPEATFYAPNRWPDGPLPELRQRARAAAPFLVEVGRELAVALDRRLSSPTSPPSSASSAAAPAQIEPGALAALVGEGERLDACPDPEVGLYVRDRRMLVLPARRGDADRVRRLLPCHRTLRPWAPEMSRGLHESILGGLLPAARTRGSPVAARYGFSRCRQQSS
mmetsp:Transcript_977/g.3963  ORF Transcript_977/g.3963 Transcript_977/m.3963 type:complete len:293 (-) Transcript_977:174-1052(-)